MGSQPRVSYSGGGTGNPVRDSALALVPETMDAYLALNQLIWEAGPLSPAEVEVARLRNARRVNCVFCRAARYGIATAAGLTEERVAMIDDDFQDSELSAREKLIIAFTDQFHDGPAAISVELQRSLRKAFTEAECVQLGLAVAHFAGFSRCAVSLGGMPDELPVIPMSVAR